MDIGARRRQHREQLAEGSLIVSVEADHLKPGSEEGGLLEPSRGQLGPREAHVPNDRELDEVAEARVRELDAPLALQMLLRLAGLLFGASSHKVGHVLPANFPQPELGARRGHVELRQVLPEHVELEVDVLEREGRLRVDEAPVHRRSTH